MRQELSIADMFSMHREKSPLVVVNEATARGLDLPIQAVFLWGTPKDPAKYLHMAGRTGRAGKKGIVITLVTVLSSSV